MQTDKVCGIDRYPNSQFRGMLESKIIFLWKSPGTAITAKNLTGVLKHGDDVLVMEKSVYKDTLWCKVRAATKTEKVGMSALKRMIQKLEKSEPPEYQDGWVKAQMLEKIGADYIKTHYGGVYEREQPETASN